MEYKIELGVEHLKRACKTNYSEALKQIIWNSIDADANNIYINFIRNNPIDENLITKIIIKDDGNGLDADNIEESLVTYGKSEKSFSLMSPGGRNYHGKLGEGRYSYYSLGSSIKWKSCYKKDGKNYNYDIVFGLEPGINLSITDKTECDESTGLTVEISFVSEKASNHLNEKEKVYKDLMLEFGPYLLAYKEINVYYDDVKLEVHDYVDLDKDYTSVIDDIYFQLKIIKWKNINSNELFVCGENNVVYNHYKSEDIEHKEISAHISSKFFDVVKLNNEIDIWNMTEMGIKINEFIKESLFTFSNEIQNNKNQEIIQKLIDNDAYPFNKPYLTIREENQKKMFDVVAIEVVKKAPFLVKANKASQKLTFNLINEAINNNPSSLKKILNEVLRLTPAEQDEFAKLLDRTSLSAIISTMSEVENRISFLEELTELVYGDIGKHIKERTQFQKLLLSQLWIFGDKYKYGTDDVNLRNVLKKYIKHLGRDDIFLTEDDYNNKDFNKIPDIVLWNNQKIGENFENLVVEIKRPTKVLGEKELSQIKHYAYSIVDDPRFSVSNTKWRFILIGQDYDSFVEKDLSSNPDGLCGTNYVIEVLKWSKLIGDNKLRYNYFKEKAKVQLDESRVKESLDNRWKELLGEDSSSNQ